MSQGPRRLRRLPRRLALGRAAVMGDAAHRLRSELPRLLLALAHRHQAGASAAPLDGELFGLDLLFRRDCSRY